ncbi:hypothetical protein HXA34_13030 [Salipaludibacillus agaradhaerens]|uniref:Uncharacterized protein n=1 Tax=Salipaludibacillus agaradhaerens TaxID=76935 RepID=A0A9Q4B0G5_SALAG|nr:hypothetical protein [Salipaludibacillus agaradhaerens]MCR6095891.1 hypothetical protein [Salipaludibacillus agaradhaerens]MCR6107222.1 hypothetical protein [Salipaludibacillus agaradhaerens]MCR6114550.1 hypothetical protein [Salipaludibacillus agaradhaerens]MCR6119251.1 hypothetical protein [Salipaludibacillus agaradhaerens]
MKKSDFLDELRLEVGLAYDYANNQDDFIVRVLKTIHAYKKKKLTLTVHAYDKGQFRLTYALGIKGLSRFEENFGHGFLMVDRIHALTYVRKFQDHAMFLPIREKGKLVYIITIRLFNSNYQVTKQDMIFAEELIHFIEAKRSSF